MSVTTMKIQSEVRDKLAKLAADDYAGATMSDALAHLIAEHEQERIRRQIATAYARLQDDPKQWAEYVDELDEWDGVTADDGGTAA